MNTPIRWHKVFGVAALLFGVSLAQAQHSGDVWVGRSSAGQLKISSQGYVPEENYHTLYPVSGLLNGWTDDSPGFDHISTDDPPADLYRLQSGAQIWLEVVALDPAFRLIDSVFQILDAPGEQTYLGDHTLHVHNTWHINSDDPAYDPDQCVWHAAFILRDTGSTQYVPSEPFTFSFTNVPVRPSGTPADGDFDADQDVDTDDYRALAACLGGPDLIPDPDDPEVTTCEVECLNAFDFDDDRDVDLRDFAGFQLVFGP